VRDNAELKILRAKWKPCGAAGAGRRPCRTDVQVQRNGQGERRDLADTNEKRFMVEQTFPCLQEIIREGIAVKDARSCSASWNP